METFNFSKTFSGGDTFSLNKKLNSTFTPTSNNFFNLEEFRELKLKRVAIDQKIKFRKDFENTYHNLKLNDLEKEIEEIKFKNSISKQRNEDLLNSIQNDIYKCHQIVKISDHSKNLLENEQKRYKNYLSYQLHNIRKEFEHKMLTKHNEIQNIQKIMQNQLKQNEEVYKIENEYAMKVSKMNDELLKKIVMLNEENTKIENERKSVMKNYSLLEENSREAVLKIFEEKNENVHSKGEMINKGDDFNSNSNYKNKKENETNQVDVEKIVKIQKVEKSAPQNTPKNIAPILDERINSEKAKSPHQEKNPLQSTNPNFLQPNSKEKKVNQLVKNISPILESIAPIQENRLNITIPQKLGENKQVDKSKIRESIEEIKNEPSKKANQSVSRKPGLLGDIRKKKQEEEKNPLGNPISRNNNEKNESFSKYFMKENSSIENRNNSFKEDIPIHPNSNSESLNYLDDSDLKKEKFLINSHSQNNYDNTNILKLDDSMISNKIIAKNNSSLNNVSSSKNENYSDLEKMIKEKPELTKISKNYKLQILNKILIQIEKNSKSIKPNNPSTHLFQTKHMNLNSNKDNIKLKFYEILEEILFLNNSSNKENVDNIISKITTDMLIFISLWLLHSNPNFNINPENLKKSEYNQQLFENDLDINYSKEFFDLILILIKKLIIDKKTSPNVAANVIANSLMNFEKDQRMTSNLVAVLERKLTDKFSQTAGGWGSFQFTRINIFI